MRTFAHNQFVSSNNIVPQTPHLRQSEKLKTSLFLPPELRRAVRIKSAPSGISLQKLVASLLEQWVANDNPNQQEPNSHA